MRYQQCNMVMVDCLLNMDLNKVIESGHNWTLANDVELLKCLEKFSENVVCNASVTLASMDNLEDCLDETFLRVRTVANKFQSIADSQFIENRVQEEEEFVLANENQKSSENIELSPETSKVQLLESIRVCQIELRKKFETVEVSGIDSEDEMTHASPVVLVPKNVYKERRLPHLIGGKQFIADDTLGLMANARTTDDYIESEEEIDEIDRSSYYSNSLKKSVEDQGEAAVGLLFSPGLIETEVQKASPDRNLNSKVSCGNESEVISEDERVSSSTNSVRIKNELHPDNHRGSTDEDKRLFDEKSSLFEVNSNFPSEDFESQTPLDGNKTCTSSPTDTNIETTREKLLAGRNITSFKEDLARVLSNAGPFRMVGSPDTVGHKPVTPSSVRNRSVKGFLEDEAEQECVTPSPVSTPSHSTPESSSLPPTSVPKPRVSAVPSGENSSSVILPNVSTNTLENLAKGRPKVKGNRRLPSRGHRQRGASLDSGSPIANTPNSAHSDVSHQESGSTQPGSNVLSPATDEEDLFVLPAFDLPTDPPSRGLFSSDTLLSPGVTIDDEFSSASPIFPTNRSMPTDLKRPSEEMVKPNTVNAPLWKDSFSKNVTADDEEVMSDNDATGSPTDIFATEVQPSLRVTTGKSEDSGVSAVDDFFPSKRSVKSALPPEDDIFSSLSSGKTTQSSPTAVKKHTLSPNSDIFASSNMIPPLSSSPPLFSDTLEPTHVAKSSSKSKSPLTSGLRWDLLGSDDFGEDLFRSSKRDSPPLSEPAQQKRTAPSSRDIPQKNNDDMFVPASFDKSQDGLFFEDDAFSSSNIFSGSSSFLRLSLPSNAKDSLFASDDDEDDDSLFKTAGKSTSNRLTEPSGPAEVKNSKQSSTNSASHNLLKNPLMSMEDDD